MPKREAMPPASLERLMANEREASKISVLFEKTRVPLYVGHWWVAIRAGREYPDERWSASRFEDVIKFDPKLVTVILVRGWRDAIGGYLGRAELEARGYEVKMVAL